MRISDWSSDVCSSDLLQACRTMAAEWPGLEGMDLAAEVSCRQTYRWDETRWALGQGYGHQTAPRHKVVAVDYDPTLNILRCLASPGCEVTVVPEAATQIGRAEGRERVWQYGSKP